MQLAWASLGNGRHSVSVGPEQAEVDGDAGTWTATGLAAGTTYEVMVDDLPVGTATTLGALPGPERCRVATVSDCHIGEKGFGFLLEMKDRPDLEPYPLRCLRAATSAATAWGAQLLVVKGDLVQRGTVEELDAAMEVLAVLPIPVVVAPGNHETKREAADWAAAVRMAGLTAVSPVNPVITDLPGLRVVTGDTTIPHHHKGALTNGRSEAFIGAAAGGDRPALVCLHHRLEQRRYRDCWPPAIPGIESEPFLDGLAAAAPRTWVTTGHTHRNRGRRHGPLTITEVGSTKDFPGTWAGYTVHDTGMHQTSFHVTGDATDAWLDRTRKAAGGAWGIWSPGRISDRCLTMNW